MIVRKGWPCFWWKLQIEKKVSVVTRMWNSVVKEADCSKWETAKWPTRSSGFLVPKAHEWGPRILPLPFSHEFSYSPFTIWKTQALCLLIHQDQITDARYLRIFLGFHRSIFFITLKHHTFLSTVSTNIKRYCIIKYPTLRDN